ncbi:alpha/beta hydrolase [Microbacterium stercoris]|uniref:Alpha/beta hydrolase n=1 Tax=Microbacterium stercoris TaxID=2820289 RepID=A0A939TLC7_9MICO|nr:alpha/beta hydrolase [Microbacterium stercoris]MBO3661993.1 alpha/beta hydrolase [Microbacterium stercoris]
MSGGASVARGLRPALEQLTRELPNRLADVDDLLRYRRASEERGTTADALSRAHRLSTHELIVEGNAVTVFRPQTDPVARAVFVHGGGLIAGNRFDGVDILLRHANALALEVWTLDYPLAPEGRFGEMAAAALAVLRRAGADGRRLLLAGQSAGGAVGATAGLLARDAGVPCDGLLLVCPMLAPGGAERSDADPSWDAVTDSTAWAAALGEGDVPPGRRTDLAGLPPTYLDAGSVELFRSAIADFAEGLHRAGVATELHIWSGAFHASDCVAEAAPASAESHRVRAGWLRRWLLDEL